MKVLGIDPGSIRCGYALLEDLGGRVPLLREAGTWNLGSSSPLPHRLGLLQTRVEEALDAHKPDCLCIEESFVHLNVRSAMVLGHARGVVIACCARRDMEILELSPSEAKKTIAGSGRATKEAVAEMCRRLLALESLPVGPDASDALALGLAALSRGKTSALLGAEKARGGFDLEAYLKRIGKTSG